MGKFVPGVFFAILFTVGLDAQNRESLQPLTWMDLRERPVIGALGVPLGTVAEVEATVVSGRKLRRKADSSSYLLKITHVNQKQLDEPRVMHFTVYDFIPVALAKDAFALHKLKTGEKASRLDDAMIQQLEQGCVGKTFRLAAYEEGVFRGIPSDLPEDVPVWQDVGFGFQTSLVVLTDRSAPTDDTDDAVESSIPR